MNSKNSPIGFFDSGVGGLSVLKDALSIMPTENFIYFGDSKNAPYGVKDLEEVRKLTLNAVEFFLQKNVKAIVIACNTATSAAIDILRETYKDLIIIGIEPALKPAIELNRNGNIIIMATPMTLRENKFKKLMEKYKENKIIPMQCAGLVEFIENGILEGPELEEYLINKFEPYLKEELSTVVLGCTHYPFIKDTISKILGKDVQILDGGMGTSHELQRKLKEKDLLNDSNEASNVIIYNSNNDNKIIDFCYNLINREKQI